MTAIILLDPEQPSPAWAPFIHASPIAELRAGGWTIAERWARALEGRVTAIIADHVKGPRPSQCTPIAEPRDVAGPSWVVDATFCPKLPLRATGSAKRLLHAGRTVAWRLDAGERWEGPHSSGDGLVIDGMRLEGSWSLVDALEQLLFHDTLLGLDAGTVAIPEGVIVLGNPGAVALRDGASVEPGVVLDVRKGAIILETGVEVRSGTRLEGPCWIRDFTIVAGGALRHVSTGPHCRLHGEISTTTFAGYANKSHEGFLGHSVIGEWVNLGAGTITSNLKNTYGPVRLDLGTTRLDTGRTNLGSLIGDHVKTAIGTLLPTGAVIGAGAHLFGAPRSGKYVRPFAWGESEACLSLSAFLDIAHRVLPRRGVAVDAATVASLRALYHRLVPTE